jgi:hypothetical protein
MIKGSLKADGVAIMEIAHCSFLAGVENPRMKARVAYIKTDSGATMGQVDHENWSKETLEKLRALRMSMEEDVAAVYLTNHTRTTGAPGTSTMVANAPKGLLDHLGRDDDAQAG